MSWLLPATIASACAVFVLCAVNVYLYSAYRERFLRLWAAAWAFYLLRYLALITGLTTGRSLAASFAYDAFVVLSAIFLLMGARAFLGKRDIATPVLIGFAVVAWTAIALAMRLPQVAIHVPIFGFLAAVDIYIGALMLNAAQTAGTRGLRFVGWLFILWGAHQADYPLLRPVEWFAPWGYVLSAVIALAVAFGLIILYFERVQSALRDYRTRLDLALHSAGMGVWHWDIPADRRHFDAQTCRLLGLDPERFNGSAPAFFAAIHPEDRDTVRKALAATMERDVLYEPEYRVVLAGGAVRHLTARGRLLRDSAGRPLRINGVLWDITDRKRGEEMLRFVAQRGWTSTREGFFTSLAEHIGRTLDVDYVVIDRLKDANTARTVGLYAKGKVLPNMEYALRGTPCVNVVGKGICHYPDAVQARFPEDGMLADMGARSYIGTPLWDSEGNPIGLIAVLDSEPMSDARQAAAILQVAAVRVAGELERQRFDDQTLDMERRMLHVQKLESLGVLAGGIAHDFNNILMAVLGHADLALTRLPPTSPARESIAEIEKASRRAADLCRQMLAYSGKGRFVIEPIRLGDLVAEMLHILKAAISKRAVIRLDLADGLPLMEGDATQVRQVVMNLVTNASDAIADRDGVITVSTGVMPCDRAFLVDVGATPDLPEGRYVYVEVSDTGCGMTTEVMARIFDPFFSTKLAGRGLGLAAVQGIVRGHKGAIRITSEPGKGATFRVLFPVTPEADAVPAPARSGRLPRFQGAPAVLLVDDEEANRTLGREMLKIIGLECVAAADGHEALRLYQQQRDRIGLVILDLTMPRMDGEETFRELRRINPDVRVIIASGYTEHDAAGRFAGTGLAGFLQKPYSTRALAAMVRATLEERAP